MRFTHETVLNVTYLTPSLLIFSTTRDQNFNFTPGHYARIGLKHTNEEVVWRPISIVSSKYDYFLEFYVLLVPSGEFSSQLAKICEGDLIKVDTSSYGFMTIDGLESGKDLWLIATGTGIGPFLSILRDCNTWRAYENVVLVHSVRRAVELAYRDKISEIIDFHKTNKMLSQIHYIPIVTREICADILSVRIPQMIENGQLEQITGLNLDLKYSRVMACGNPQMILELRSLFTAKGFKTNRRGMPGQLSFENYWLNRP